MVTVTESTIHALCLSPETLLQQAAEEEHKRLMEGGILGPGVSYGLLHGRLGAAEKTAALAAFASGETNVLIATTVVEVMRHNSFCFRSSQQ